MEQVIWKEDHLGVNDPAFLIDPAEINDCVQLSDGTLIIRGIEVHETEIEELIVKLKEYQEDLNDLDEVFDPYSRDDLQLFLESLGYTPSIDYAENYMIPESVLAFEPYDQIFFNVLDCETNKFYQWLDKHSNWTTKVFDINTMTETKLIISQEYVDLDEWDGRDFKTGTIGLHQRIYKIYNLDGDEVEDQFLLYEWSQWQGDHQTGIILNLEEVKKHIEELGNRDVDNYINEINKL